MKKLNLWILLIIGGIANMVIFNYSLEALSAPDDFLVFMGIVGVAIVINIMCWLIKLSKKIGKIN